MTAPAPTRLSISLGASDRLVLVAGLLLAAGVLTWQAAGRKAPAGEDLPVNSLRVALVAERIDPNTASVASLRRLAQIGPAKAKVIVAYRAAAARRGRQRPFEFAEDLTRIKGIGAATVSRIARHLAIPSRLATADE